MLNNNDFKRLQWHSRRGMLELDVLLGPFTDKIYNSLSEQDQQGYKDLIDCEDPDLFSWFMSENRPEDPQLSRMVDLVLNHARGNLPQTLVSE